MWEPSSIAVIVVAVVAGCFSSWHTKCKPYAFAVWVLAFVIVAYFVPDLFLKWFGKPTSSLVSPLIQVAMFGMGATLTGQDFIRVLKMPKAVGVGIMLQFTVMPLTGWALAVLFQLPPEVAAGVVLIGACPGGVSSNVITYLAKGNVALSVTMTACSTLVSPLVTPAFMKLLAGRMIQVNVSDMFFSILWIVILPIVLGLIANQVLVRLRMDLTKAESVLSILAMIAICIICAIIVAGAHKALTTVGPILVLIVAIHNSFGYLLGYWGSKVLGLSESDCRTVAIEVGLQNGGMGASLATEVLKSSQAALAPAIFAPWMNATGSVLAAWWRKR